MAARVIEIADAVAAYVASQTYKFSFNVERKNPRYFEVDKNATTWLLVYPGPEGPTTATRNRWQHVYSTTIHLINYNDSMTQAEIDDTFELMEEIVDSLKEAKVAGRYLQEFSTEDNPEEPYLAEGLARHNLAESVRRLIYQELK